MAEKLKITLVKSPIGAIPKQKATVAALGLNKTGKTVEQPDNAAIRGMIQNVRHLVKVEDDVTFADACMAVFVSAKRIQAVIQVDGAQTGKTDDAVKFGENLIQVIDDVIAAIPDMAGIQADTEMVGEFNAVDDFPKLFKAAADFTSFS